MMRATSAAFGLLPMLCLTMMSAAASAAGIRACPDVAADDYYFPRGALASGDQKVDAFVRRWYSRQLAAMAEPPLSCGDGPVVHRFTWLRTFHHPVAVRISDDGWRVSLSAIELDGAGGYGPGKRLRRVERTLRFDEAKTLGDALDAAALWRLPAVVESNGRDGAEWIFETRDAGRYHLVVRWSPRHGAIRSLGLVFLKLAGWQYPDEQTY